MQLEHSFTVPVGVDEAWRVLLDIEQVATCMPGATLDSVDGDDFTGSVKVRVGPIGLVYRGKARFSEKDEAARRAVIDAQGKDARGNGTAAAHVAATLHPDGDSTTVEVVTDLNVTGKPAQFGRGVMADIGNKLIGQFADCLAGRLATGGAAAGGADSAAPPAATEGSAGPASAVAAAGSPSVAAAGSTTGAGPASSGGSAPTEPPETEPIDLLASAGPAIAKRVVPVVLGLVVVLIVLRRLIRA
jgi:uncharacterized protein